MSAISHTQLECRMCQRPCYRKGHSSDVVICPACASFNSPSGAEMDGKISAKILANNALIKIGDSLKTGHGPALVLGLQQLYYAAGYSNFWYSEPKTLHEAYIEESYDTYYYLMPFSTNAGKLLTTGKKPGSYFDLTGEGKLLCTAIRQVVFHAEAGELKRIGNFNQQAFMLEAQNTENKQEYRFFIFKDKTVSAFKGAAIPFSKLKSS